MILADGADAFGQGMADGAGIYRSRWTYSASLSGAAVLKALMMMPVIGWKGGKDEQDV
ncbi:hypothetical protein [Sphingopyxis sp. OAS728]|uniref:hypothetical protein n=1 Tax=Sphingopyxis sp. OAS728 TaxID=2663823 RepID=UPI00178B0AB0|nr:hypothetical protein [Sphingopyxis sp. OAS728]